MNYDIITLEDILDMYEKKDLRATINDGKLIGFDREYAEPIWGKNQWRRK
jgi:hypothetical protein